MCRQRSNRNPLHGYNSGATEPTIFSLTTNWVPEPTIFSLTSGAQEPTIFRFPHSQVELTDFQGASGSICGAICPSTICGALEPAVSHGGMKSTKPTSTGGEYLDDHMTFSHSFILNRLKSRKSLNKRNAILDCHSINTTCATAIWERLGKPRGKHAL